MGKQTGDIERVVIETKAPSGPSRGLDVDLSGRGNKLAAIGILLLVGCPVVWFVLGSPMLDSSPKPAPTPRSAPWPGWRYIGYILLALLVLIVVAIVGYIIVTIYAAGRERLARAKAAEIEARKVRPDENGRAPRMLTKDLDKMVDPDAAPAGVVQGLNGKGPLEMPAPETEAHAIAAARAAVISVVAGAGHLAGAALEAMGGHALPPTLPRRLEIEAETGDTARLLEAAREEWDIVEAEDDA